MKKILVLPLFTMESGHHRAADALIDSFKKKNSYIQCEKLDFLTYLNPLFEKSISNMYLKWINNKPIIYSKFYKHFFFKKSVILRSIYETLFLEKMEQLLGEKQPDLIICTHSFPSFLVNKLKEYGVCKTPMINVYTDFFINDLWGINHVDMHCVPSKEIKNELIKASVPKENIIITGIVTNDLVSKRQVRQANKKKTHILVSGGSLGLGNQISFLKQPVNSSFVEYRVLCGSNAKLFNEIVSLNINSIKPLPYITCSEQMNHLYNWADALITKPGGVTISEGIKKRIPIFIHSVLPGQEEINMNYLEQKGLVQKLNRNKSVEEQVVTFLKNPTAIININKAINLFLSELEMYSCEEVASYIVEKVTSQTSNKRVQYLDQIFSRIYCGL
ncbi:MGDG synthase family glycosyltransferase [Fredinandcohnia onubensis]|uniref:MGDG synthase family glycosyltransferase n=1 Tax=Fredinandcohnia onubensis TaxID=1571209 RepID=UPI0015D50823|nr:galactosyldiacylglycerol synthase [Fredinandcohnia onubensis]